MELPEFLKILTEINIIVLKYGSVNHGMFQSLNDSLRPYGYQLSMVPVIKIVVPIRIEDSGVGATLVPYEPEDH